MAERIRDINPDIEVTAIAARYESENRERFFADYDYVVDAIDLVSCKIDLIMSCREQESSHYLCPGTGNKRVASLLRIDDISKTSGCALARVCAGNCGPEACCITRWCSAPRRPWEPRQLEVPPPGRRSVPGSLVWVPATAGLLLCQHVVTELIK